MQAKKTNICLIIALTALVQMKQSTRNPSWVIPAMLPLPIHQRRPKSEPQTALLPKDRASTLSSSSLDARMLTPKTGWTSTTIHLQSSSKGPVKKGIVQVKITKKARKVQVWDLRVGRLAKATEISISYGFCRKASWSVESNVWGNPILRSWYVESKWTCSFCFPGVEPGL